MQTICLAWVIVKTETTPPATSGGPSAPGGPTTADCVELLRSMQQLVRARRRSTKYQQDAGALMMMSALDGTSGIRVSALAEMLMVDISAASRQVSALENAGLIGRVPDEIDHRAQLIRLTVAGQAALAVACETAGSDIAGRISHWTETDVRTLTGLVHQLAVDLVAGEPGRARTHPSTAAGSTNPVVCQQNPALRKSES